ncbi:hypothetical protein QQF64_012163 [Cirrhinus molitorella]|uniref:Uncharacterized protein n=1 Tax=Cirrhinus molitorella TaxID=172907 RepID=A0ABR3LUV6_9TELE
MRAERSSPISVSEARALLFSHSRSFRLILSDSDLCTRHICASFLHIFASRGEEGRRGDVGVMKAINGSMEHVV